MSIRTCEDCGCDLVAKDCDNCGGEGYVEHDCGEDTCCCADPTPNVRCHWCQGTGIGYECVNCDD